MKRCSGNSRCKGPEAESRGERQCGRRSRGGALEGNRPEGADAKGVGGRF